MGPQTGREGRRLPLAHAWVTVRVARGAGAVNGEEVVAPDEAGGLKVVSIPVDELNEFEGNPRQRTEKVLGHLKKSILEFGFVDPVVVWANAEDFGYPPNTVIGGHRRLDAYKSLIENGKLKPGPAPCILVDCESERHAKALNVALNKIGEEFDVPALKDFLTDIDVGDIDVEVTGFEGVELDEIFGRGYDLSEGEEKDAGDVVLVVETGRPAVDDEINALVKHIEEVGFLVTVK